MIGLENGLERKKIIYVSYIVVRWLGQNIFSSVI